MGKNLSFVKLIGRGLNFIYEFDVCFKWNNTMYLSPWGYKSWIGGNYQIGDWGYLKPGNWARKQYPVLNCVINNQVEFPTGE